MTTQELVDRFPEIPQDLRGESVLARFAEVFDDLLQLARSPNEGSLRAKPGDHYYVKLIGPMASYKYGLCTRPRVLIQLRELMDRHAADPNGFAASLCQKEDGATEVRRTQRA